jgi:low temperature requirement protein LtrA
VLARLPGSWHGRPVSEADGKHRHEREIGAAHAVSPLELFFDLVFVFALTQVTTLLADDLTWVGMLRGFAVLAAVWWAWVAFAWLTNSITIDDDLVSRLVVLLAMGAMLVVGLAAPGAFGDTAIVFGVAYFVVRALHVLLYLYTTRGDRDVFRAVARLAPGMMIGATLIVIAGFLPPGPARVALWALALIVDFTSPLVSGTAGWKVDASHFTERHGLIIIIALGESLVALGIGATGADFTPGIVAAIALGVAVICGLWWLYFDIVSLAAERMLESVTGAARAAMARDSYSYIHFFMVWGIVLVALGLKKTLLDVDAPLKTLAVIALFGGLAMYLLAHVAFRLRNTGTINTQRLVTAVLLLALIPVAMAVPALVALSIATAVIVLLVVYETVRFRDVRHRIRFGE